MATEVIRVRLVAPCIARQLSGWTEVHLSDGTAIIYETMGVDAAIERSGYPASAALRAAQGVLTMQIRTTWRNDNPRTIANVLAKRLGREPTHAEMKAEVSRILREAPPRLVTMREAARRI